MFIDGGAERFLVDLSNELRAQGHQVVIGSLFPRTELGMSYFPDIHPEIELRFLDKQLGFDARSIFALRDLIRREKPDFIHTHLRVLNYLALAGFLGLPKTPIVHTIHNDARKEVSGDKEFKLRRFLFASKRVFPVSISEVSHQSFLDYYGLSRVRRIDNGRAMPAPSARMPELKAEVEQLRARLGSDLKIWVNIGRITPQKNQAMLVSAFARLLDEGHNGLLWILGTERSPVSEPILELMKPHLGDRIAWLGGKSNATDYLHCADFFALSSLYEGMPISLIEAMACRALPVSTPVGGIPEMVEPSGVLSRSVEEVDFADALREASALSPEDYHKRVEDLHARYTDRYSMVRCARSYVELFGELKENRL
jgi:glycosyltransferase involved in cell wall biosynthesis